MNEVTKVGKIKKVVCYALGYLPAVLMTTAFLCGSIFEKQHEKAQEKAQDLETRIYNNYVVTDEFIDDQNSKFNEINIAWKEGFISNKMRTQKINELTTQEYVINVARENGYLEADIAEIDDLYAKSEKARECSGYFGAASLGLLAPMILGLSANYALLPEKNFDKKQKKELEPVL